MIINFKSNLTGVPQKHPYWSFLRGHQFDAGRFYFGPNSTIPPVIKFALTPFRAVFHATQRARKEEVNIGYFYALLRHLTNNKTILLKYLL